MGETTRLMVTRAGLFAVVFGCFGLACGHTKPPPPAPQWIPFNAPQSAVTLPAFMVGEQGELSSGCWQPIASTDVGSADRFEWNQEKQKKLEASFQATFSKFLLKAGLEASVANAFNQQWSLHIEQLSFTKVDPANIRAKFSNPACATTALGWFVDKRLVVTAAAKAGKVSIKAKTSMSKEQKAKLEAAIQKINVELHSNFQNLATGSEDQTIEASNVYIGALGTTLVAEECLEESLSLLPDKNLAVCKGKYTVKVSPSAVTDRYTLAVTPSDGATVKFDEKFDEQQSRQLDDLRIVRAMVNKAGTGFKGRLTILLVGASGR